MHVRLRIQSHISLSEFAPSSRGSSSSLSESGRTSYSADRLSWDSGSGIMESEDGDYSDLGFDDDYRGDRNIAAHDLTQTWAQVSQASSSPQSRGSRLSVSSSYREGSTRPPLNGRQRLAPHSSTSDESDDDDQGTEYAFSSPDSRSSQLCQETRPILGQSAAGDAQRYREIQAVAAQLGASCASRGPPVHHGIICTVCRMSPISGTRYMCVMCPNGPSFCGRCEEAGRAILHTPHAASHAMLKLVEPLPATAAAAGAEGSTSAAAPVDDNSVMATALITAAQSLSVRPLQQANGSPSPPELARPLEHDCLCSFCSEPIGKGPRFLCANCPLDLPTPNSSRASERSASMSSSSSSADDLQSFHSAPAGSAGGSSIILTPHEGYNLCATCEQCSLSVHDPDHFFIRIPSPAEMVRAGCAGPCSLTPLRLNPYLSIEHRKQGLLPELYRSDDSGWQEVNLRIQSTPLRPRSSPSSSEGRASPGMLTPRSSSSPLLLSSQAAASLRSRCESPNPNRSPFRCRPRIFGGRRRVGCGEQHQLEVMGMGSATSLEGQNQNEAEGASTSVATPQNDPGDCCVLNFRSSGRCSGRGREGQSSTPTAGSPWTVVNHEAEYVNSLIHPGLMCDMCFEPIEGCWLRCVNCTHSFDVVSLRFPPIGASCVVPKGVR